MVKRMRWEGWTTLAIERVYLVIVVFLAPFGIGSCLGSIQEWGHFTRTRGDMVYTRGLSGGRKVATSRMAA